MVEGITDCYKISSWDSHQQKNVRAVLFLQFSFLKPWVDVPATLFHLDHAGYVDNYKQNGSVIL